MRLFKLHLSHFRNYESRLLEFNQLVTIITGPNAAGKTSIIEAIYLLATGDSFRAGKIEEMISFNEELGRVKAKVDVNGGLAESEVDGRQGEQASEVGRTDKAVGASRAELDEVELEVLLTRGVVQGKRTQRRMFSVNGARRSKSKFVGQFQVVVFRPEDMRLVEGSPRRRRQFLDTPLLLIDPAYARALKTYYQALTKRNRLLTQIRDGQAPRSALTYWTMTILKHGQVIQAKRQQFLEFFAGVKFAVPFSIHYDSSIISDKRLAQYADREIAAGYTLVGPHKDDFQVKLAVETEGWGEEKRDIAIYGSRGQQRMGVLWLKTCEFEFIKHQIGKRPILLLDDILSELDDHHQQLVISLLNGTQTIITSADPQIEDLVRRHGSDFATLNLVANDASALKNSSSDSSPNTNSSHID